jgi:hypothetical protein
MTHVCTSASSILKVPSPKVPMIQLQILSTIYIPYEYVNDVCLVSSWAILQVCFCSKFLNNGCKCLSSGFAISIRIRMQGFEIRSRIRVEHSTDGEKYSYFRGECQFGAACLMIRVTRITDATLIWYGPCLESGCQIGALVWIWLGSGLSGVD